MSNKADKSLKKQSSKIFKTGMLAYMGLAVLIHALFIWFYINGVGMCMGRSVNIFSAISMVSSFPTSLTLIIPPAFAVLFVVMLVMIIRDFVNSVKHFKTAITESRSDLISIKFYLFWIVHYVISTLIKMIAFVVCCNMVNKFSLNFEMKFAIVLGLLLFISVRVIIFFMRSYSLKNILLNVGYIAITVLNIGLVLQTVYSTSIKDIIESLPTWWTFFQMNPVTQIYTSAASILSMIVTFLAIYIFKVINDYELVDTKGFYSTSKTILTLTIILLAAPVAVYIWSNQGGSFDGIMPIILPHLPMIAAAAALAVIKLFPASMDEKVKNNS